MSRLSKKKIFVGMSTTKSSRDLPGQAGGFSHKRKKIVFVAMSGGVDSSVTALLLKKRGYDVVGVFMRCYNIDGCAEVDAEDARRVAEHIGIPFYVWDFEEEYKKRVVEYMVAGYRKGITPNPDVMCNREIKFGLFLKRALLMGADYVATGHYVRLLRGKLFTARDKNKDQSYFLWTLTQKELVHCLFPIGDYQKPRVRVIARKAGLPTAEKKDSQGICFVGKVSLADFLGRYIPERRGALVGLDGKKIGEHRGASFYTIGQRQGIGAVKHEKGMKLHKPLYVAAKDVKKNIVTVAEGDMNPALYRKEVTLADVNFISQKHSHILKNVRMFGKRGMRVFARVRYRQPLAPAVLEMRNEKGEMGAKLVFSKPQKFVAPGQSAVIYSKSGEMLGGGVII